MTTGHFANGLCSAVVNGKGCDLQSLLGSNSLCSTVVNGKGSDLILFFDDAKMPKDKWPSLLGSGSLCIHVVNGKGGDLTLFLDDTQIPKELLVSGSLCIAVVNGKGSDLILFLDDTQILTEPYRGAKDKVCQLSRTKSCPRREAEYCFEQRLNDSLCSAIASGRPVDLARFST